MKKPTIPVLMGVALMVSSALAIRVPTSWKKESTVTQKIERPPAAYRTILQGSEIAKPYVALNKNNNNNPKKRHNDLKTRPAAAAAVPGRNVRRPEDFNSVRRPPARKPWYEKPRFKNQKPLGRKPAAPIRPPGHGQQPEKLVNLGKVVHRPTKPLKPPQKLSNKPPQKPLRKPAEATTSVPNAPNQNQQKTEESAFQETDWVPIVPQYYPQAQLQENKPNFDLDTLYQSFRTGKSKEQLRLPAVDLKKQRYTSLDLKKHLARPKVNYNLDATPTFNFNPATTPLYQDAAGFDATPLHAAGFGATPLHASTLGAIPFNGDIPSHGAIHLQQATPLYEATLFESTPFYQEKHFQDSKGYQNPRFKNYRDDKTHEPSEDVDLNRSKGPNRGRYKYRNQELEGQKRDKQNHDGHSHDEQSHDEQNREELNDEELNEESHESDEAVQEETPAFDVPTKPVYHGEGQWAKRGQIKRPSFPSHDYLKEPQREESEATPDGHDVFERNQQLFTRAKTKFRQNHGELPQNHKDDSGDDEESEEQVAEFTPMRLYTQVRRSENEEYLPSDLAEDARLKEVVKDSKIQTVYTEEGYEDAAYDHAGHEKNAEEDEGFAEFDKEVEKEKVKAKPDASEDSDAAGSEYERDEKKPSKTMKKNNFIKTKETKTMALKDKGDGKKQMEISSEIKIVATPNSGNKTQKYVKIYPKVTKTFDSRPVEDYSRFYDESNRDHGEPSRDQVGSSRDGDEASQDHNESSRYQNELNQDEKESSQDQSNRDQESQNGSNQSAQNGLNRDQATQNNSDRDQASQNDLHRGLSNDSNRDESSQNDAESSREEVDEEYLDYQDGNPAVSELARDDAGEIEGNKYLEVADLLQLGPNWHEAEPQDDSSVRSTEGTIPDKNLEIPHLLKTRLDSIPAVTQDLTPAVTKDDPGATEESSSGVTPDSAPAATADSASDVTGDLAQAVTTDSAPASALAPASVLAPTVASDSVPAAAESNLGLVEGRKPSAAPEIDDSWHEAKPEDNPETSTSAFKIPAELQFDDIEILPSPSPPLALIQPEESVINLISNSFQDINRHKRSKRSDNSDPFPEIEVDTGFIDKIKHPDLTQQVVKQTKYPYYFDASINRDSPLRYSEDLRNVPVKTEGEMSFYRHADRTECASVEDGVDPIPERVKQGDSADGDQDTPKGPRLNNLGDKIDCFKAKYFGGDNPLDNPIFEEQTVAPVVPIFKSFRIGGVRVHKRRKESKKAAVESNEVEEQRAETTTAKGLNILTDVIAKVNETATKHPDVEIVDLNQINPLVVIERPTPVPVTIITTPKYTIELTPKHIYDQIDLLRYLPSGSERKAKTIETTTTEAPKVEALKKRRRRFRPKQRPLYQVFDVNRHLPKNTYDKPTALPKYSSVISEVHYKNEIKPSEQLNVFADVINNIKNSSNDLQGSATIPNLGTNQYARFPRFPEGEARFPADTRQQSTKYPEHLDHTKYTRYQQRYPVTQSNTRYLQDNSRYLGRYEKKPTEAIQEEEESPDLYYSTQRPKYNYENADMLELLKVRKATFSPYNTIRNDVTNDATYSGTKYSRTKLSDPKYSDAKYSDDKYSDAKYSDDKYSDDEYSDGKVAESEPEDLEEVTENRVVGLMPPQYRYKTIFKPVPVPLYTEIEEKKTMNNYPVSGMKPPSAKQKVLLYSDFRPKKYFRRRAKRDVARLNYSEVVRNRNKPIDVEDEEVIPTVADDADDYVPHRPKNYHYDEKTGRIVYDKKKEEPKVEEEDEVIYIEVTEAPLPKPTKKAFQLVDNYEGPSFVEFVKKLKTNPNYEEIPDPTTTEKPKEEANSTTTVAPKSTKPPEFLNILAKVKSSSDYKEIKDKDKKKTGTTTEVPAEEEEEDDEEDPRPIQNSRGGVISADNYQIFDISEYLPKVKNYSPRTSIDYSKYKTIERPSTRHNLSSRYNSDDEDLENVKTSRVPVLMLNEESTTASTSTTSTTTTTTTTTQKPTTKRVLRTRNRTRKPLTASTAASGASALAAEASTEHVKTSTEHIKRVYPRRRPTRIKLSRSNDPDPVKLEAEGTTKSVHRRHQPEDYDEATEQLEEDTEDYYVVTPQGRDDYHEGFLEDSDVDDHTATAEDQEAVVEERGITPEEYAKALEVREKALEGRETALEGREKGLDGRERALAGREKALECREKALEPIVVDRKGNVKGGRPEDCGKMLEHAETALEGHEEVPEATVEDQEGNVENDEISLADRETALGGREGALVGREAALEGREKALGGRERALEGREKALEAREKARGSSAPEANKPPQNRQTLVKGRETALEGRVKVLQGRRVALAGREKALEDREKALGGSRSALKATVADHEADVEDRGRTPEDDENPENGEISLKGRETALEGRETEFEGRETALEDRERALEGREKALDNREKGPEDEKDALKARGRTLESNRKRTLQEARRGARALEQVRDEDYTDPEEELEEDRRPVRNPKLSVTTKAPRFEPRKISEDVLVFKQYDAMQKHGGNYKHEKDTSAKKDTVKEESKGESRLTDVVPKPFAFYTDPKLPKNVNSLMEVNTNVEEVEDANREIEEPKGEDYENHDYVTEEKDEHEENDGEEIEDKEQQGRGVKKEKKRYEKEAEDRNDNYDEVQVEFEDKTTKKPIFIKDPGKRLYYYAPV